MSWDCEFFLQLPVPSCSRTSLQPRYSSKCLFSIRWSANETQSWNVWDNERVAMESWRATPSSHSRSNVKQDEHYIKRLNQVTIPGGERCLHLIRRTSMLLAKSHAIRIHQRYTIVTNRVTKIQPESIHKDETTDRKTKRTFEIQDHCVKWRSIHQERVLKEWAALMIRFFFCSKSHSGLTDSNISTMPVELCPSKTLSSIFILWLSVGVQSFLIWHRWS
jgi:hypothetical protein